MMASQCLTDAITTARLPAAFALAEPSAMPTSLLRDLQIDIGFTDIGSMDAVMMHSRNKD
jgi:hypothetical protein